MGSRAHNKMDGCWRELQIAEESRKRTACSRQTPTFASDEPSSAAILPRLADGGAAAPTWRRARISRHITRYFIKLLHPQLSGLGFRYHPPPEVQMCPSYIITTYCSAALLISISSSAAVSLRVLQRWELL